MPAEAEPASAGPLSSLLFGTQQAHTPAQPPAPGPPGPPGGGGGGSGNNDAGNFLDKLGYVPALCIVLFSFALPVLYIVYRYARERRHAGPGRSSFAAWAGTLFQLGRAGRLEWMRHVLADGGQGMLAVQTLRNLISVAAFGATTAAFLAQIIVYIVLDRKRMAALDRFPSDLKIPTVVKLTASIGTLFVSFFCFTQVLRFSVHLGFLLQAAAARRRPSDPPSAVPLATLESMLLQSQFYFSVGLRAFYAFIPLILWAVAGPVGLLAGSVSLVVINALMDNVQGVDADGSPEADGDSPGGTGGSAIGRAAGGARAPADARAMGSDHWAGGVVVPGPGAAATPHGEDPAGIHAPLLGPWGASNPWGASDGRAAAAHAGGSPRA